MSNKEMKDELQEDTSGVSDENTGIEEKSMQPWIKS